MIERQDLLVSQEGNVLQLILNRPDALNAFTPDMMEGLLEALEHAKSNPDVRAILLRGSGRSFCAGGDVKGMGKAEPVQVYEHIGHLNQVVKTMTDLPVPIIAAIHGYAAGAGVCLALACDLIVAADTSKFVMSFSKIGLISDGGGLYFLPRTIGLYRAKELLFTAEPIDAQTAQNWGMVNRVYPEQELFEQAMQFAQKIANGPSRAYGMIKSIANRALLEDLAGILEIERTTQAMMVTTQDHKEGVQAFLEKRSPKYVGR
jgi:2-(1,2-epoxy-1,2-dihydrophenyl)acetyl-CoA isomerase